MKTQHKHTWQSQTNLEIFSISENSVFEVSFAEYNKKTLDFPIDEDRIFNISEFCRTVNAIGYKGKSNLASGNFSGNSESLKSNIQSTPKLALGKFNKLGVNRIEPTTINVSLALIDSYKAGLLNESLQFHLNSQ